MRLALDIRQGGRFADVFVVGERMDRRLDFAFGGDSHSGRAGK